jgi:CRP-like cAMP-binding protein
MLMSHPPFMKQMVRKLERRAALGEADRQALLDLPFQLQTVERSIYVVREGERPDHCSLVVSGFAYQQKITLRGARQIVSVHMPGDFIDLDSAFLSIADHNVQALTRCELAMISRDHLRDMMKAHPVIALALWIDTLVDASIFREWIVNIGRRDARSRIGHLLCEFARRLEVAGLAEDYSYELPMTQEQIGDAVGLTPVHVNRVLREFDREGLIDRSKRLVIIRDWDRLRTIADFSETYLHLDQVDRERSHSQGRLANLRA